MKFSKSTSDRAASISSIIAGNACSPSCKISISVATRVGAPTNSARSAMLSTAGLRRSTVKGSFMGGSTPEDPCPAPRDRVEFDSRGYHNGADSHRLVRARTPRIRIASEGRESARNPDRSSARPVRSRCNIRGVGDDQRERFALLQPFASFEEEECEQTDGEQCRQIDREHRG